MLTPNGIIKRSLDGAFGGISLNLKSASCENGRKHSSSKHIHIHVDFSVGYKDCRVQILAGEFLFEVANGTLCEPTIFQVIASVAAQGTRANIYTVTELITALSIIL